MRNDSPGSAIQIALGAFLFLFFLTGAAYLVLGQPDRSDLQTVSGLLQNKQLRGSKFRRHVEFDVEGRHLQYDGLDQARISAYLEPGMRITALVHPHAYRSGILMVEELSVDGQVLITHEARRRHYRRFGYVALAFALVSLGYVLYCWRSMKTARAKGY